MSELYMGQSYLLVKITQAYYYLSEISSQNYIGMILVNNLAFCLEEILLVLLTTPKNTKSPKVEAS